MPAIDNESNIIF